MNGVLATRGQTVALCIVLLFAVVTRLGWVLHIRDVDPAATRSPDTPSYVQPARALVHRGAFDTAPGTHDPIYLRTPGYPTLIGAVFVVDESETLVLVLQVLASCLTVLLAYWIAARLWGATVGVVAAALVALEPLQFVASGTLLTESVWSLALLVVAALGFRVFTAGPLRLQWCILLGAAVAVATLIRPTTYYFPVFVTALLLVRVRRYGLRKLVAGIAVFLVPVVVLVGGWQVRNHVDAGSWRFSGIEGLNLYWFRGADTFAQHQGITIAAARKHLPRDIGSNPYVCSDAYHCDPTRPGVFYDDLYARGFSLVTTYPVETVEGAARGLAREAFGPGTETVAYYLDVADSGPLKLALAGALLCFYVALGCGLVVLLRHPDGRGMAHVFALGTAAYVLLVSAGPEGYARLRGPVMPILALYAALGVVGGVRRISAISRREPRGAARDSPGGRSADRVEHAPHL